MFLFLLNWLLRGTYAHLFLGFFLKKSSIWQMDLATNTVALALPLLKIMGTLGLVSALVREDWFSQ
jgi:hypothetical protein